MACSNNSKSDETKEGTTSSIKQILGGLATAGTIGLVSWGLSISKNDARQDILLDNQDQKLMRVIESQDKLVESVQELTVEIAKYVSEKRRYNDNNNNGGH